MKVVALGSKPFVSGFRLAGVPGIEISSPEELLKEVENQISLGDVGLIIVDEDYARAVRDRLAEIRAVNPTPLIYELPGPGTKPEKIDYRSMLRKILGV